jgi:3-methyladenine DNA glycosylase/8-oxoguanine DNA glycosylase
MERVLQKTALQRTIDAPGIDPGLVLGPLAMMPTDPTLHLSRRHAVRATLTPDGPGVIRLEWGQARGVVTVETSGDGAGWLLDRADRLIGVHDDVQGFQPDDPIVRRLWARFDGDRVPATGTLWHDLAWTITQQRVHRRDAAQQWHRLVREFGAPCPDHENLYFPPEPEAIARLVPWQLRRMGIDEHRAQALIGTARLAPRLQALVDDDAERVLSALASVRGIGPWTRSCLAAFTWGDPDTVIIGDVGIPSLVSFTLGGPRRADDAAMLEMLEPYRPHRYRILRLAFAARMAPGRA